MAILKNLIVEGDTRIIGDTNTAKITTGDIIVQECNNSWLTPARLQIGRINSSAYSDRACVGVTDGNLHIDPYPNKALYLSYYNQGTINLGRSASVTSGGAIYGTAIYDNGTRVLTSHQTLKTINSQSIVGSGNISVGTYSKPSGGIPASDLTTSIQNVLGVVIHGSGNNSGKTPNLVSATSQSILNLDGYYHLLMSASANSTTINYQLYWRSSISSLFSITTMFHRIDMDVIGTKITGTGLNSAIITSYTTGSSGSGTITVDTPLSSSAFSNVDMRVYYSVGSVASGENSISLGVLSNATGKASTAFGIRTQATGNGSIVFGVGSKFGSVSIGDIKSTGIGAIAGGYANVSSPGSGNITASGNGSIAIGAINSTCYITASYPGSMVIGAAEDYSSYIKATATGAWAGGASMEASEIIASGEGAFAHGCSSDSAYVYASSDGSAAIGTAHMNSNLKTEGNGSIVIGYVAGNSTINSKKYGSIAAGCSEDSSTILSTASGAIAFGYTSDEGVIKATGEGSVAHGYTSDIRGNEHFIEARGAGSTACGYAVYQNAYPGDAGSLSVFANGNGSFASGGAISTLNDFEHGFGFGNSSHKKTNGTTDENKAGSTRFSIGVGTAGTSRANAIEVMQNGDVYIKGMGGYNGTNPDTATSRPIQQLLNMAPTMRISRVKIGTTDTKTIYIDHPLIDHPNAEVVLVRYNRRCGKKRSGGNRVYKKGWCIASTEDQEYYFTFEKSTQWDNFETFVRSKLVNINRHFGIALRIPNPKWTRSATPQKNGIYKGVPESLWSDVLPIMLSAYNVGNTQHISVGLI